MKDDEGLLVNTSQVAFGRVADNLTNEAPTLTLARLEIDVLPEALLASSARCRVAHIMVLILKHNRLQLLPSELFICMPQLHEIDVSENQLSYLPETIGLLAGLRKLNLERNRIRSLPEGFCFLHFLEDLRLGHNYLERLPEAIGALKRLRRLDLPNNLLELIPDEAGSLQALQHVDLSGNPIQRMPLFIQRLQTKGELLRSKSRRQQLVGRALQVRGAVRAAFIDEAFGDET